jgi:hypothetical protein
MISRMMKMPRPRAPRKAGSSGAGARASRRSAEKPGPSSVTTMRKRAWLRPNSTATLSAGLKRLPCSMALLTASMLAMEI